MCLRSLTSFSCDLSSQVRMKRERTDPEQVFAPAVRELCPSGMGEYQLRCLRKVPCLYHVVFASTFDDLDYEAGN